MGLDRTNYPQRAIASLRAATEDGEQVGIAPEPTLPVYAASAPTASEQAYDNESRVPHGMMLQLGADTHDAIPDAVAVNPGSIRFDTQTGDISSLDPSALPRSGVSAFAPTAQRFSNLHLPFRDGVADYVLQTGFYIGDHPHGIAELSRVLKDGGEVWSRYDKRGDFMAEAPPIGGGGREDHEGVAKCGFGRTANVVITEPGPFQGNWSVYRKLSRTDSP
jgi:hypothetical protein